MSSAWAPLGVSLLLLCAAVCGIVVNENREICLLPLIKGPCRAMITRYYYDRETQSCKVFFYGGCEGNDNNFETEDECDKVCWMIKKVPKICRLEPVTGICRGLFRRYFYNLKTKQCEQFIYGGCNGNNNNFLDESACWDYCDPKSDGIDTWKRGGNRIKLLPQLEYAPFFCSSVKDEGACSASVLRYYYDPEDQECEEFEYSGCGGNNNNFVSISDCESVCKKGTRKRRRKPFYRNLKLLTPLKRTRATRHMA